MSDHEKLLQKRIKELELELEKAKNERSTIGRCKIEQMSSEVVDSNPYRSVKLFLFSRLLPFLSHK